MPQELDELTFQIDHVIAASHGGPTRASNLCLACFRCNSFKGPNLAGVDDRARRVVRLFNPQHTSGSGTFAGTVRALVGRTPSGRAPSPRYASTSPTVSPSATL